MENTSCWTAPRTDAALPAAHGGTLLASGTRSGARAVAAKRVMGIDAPVSFVAPTYVVDQESPPPRGNPA